MPATALQRRTNERTIEDYVALTRALSKRGETKLSEKGCIEQWTRTYSYKRDERGKLQMLDIFNPSRYYISNDFSSNRLYVWVGRTQDTAGKLNTGAREYLIAEGLRT